MTLEEMYKNIGKNDKYWAIKRGLESKEVWIEIEFLLTIKACIWWIHDKVPERRTNDPSSVCKQCEITENNNEQIVERTGLCGQDSH